MTIVTSKEVALRLLRERRNLKDFEFHNISLRKEDLSGLQFSNSVWRDCDFLNTDFSKCQMVGVQFFNSNCRFANFDGAIMDDFLFDNCPLEKARFVGCEWRNVRFLNGTKLCQSIISIGDYLKRSAIVDREHYKELMKFVKPAD